MQKKRREGKNAGKKGMAYSDNGARGADIAAKVSLASKKLSKLSVASDNGGVVWLHGHGSGRAGKGDDESGDDGVEAHIGGFDLFSWVRKV